MQRHGERVEPQFLDRPRQYDLLAVDREAGGGRGIRGVARRDRTVERAGVRGRADHDEPLAVELVGQGLGFGLGLEVARLELGLLRFEGLEIGLGRPERLFLRQKEVAGVAVLDGHDLAHLAELGDAFQ